MSWIQASGQSSGLLQGTASSSGLLQQTDRAQHVPYPCKACAISLHSMCHIPAVCAISLHSVCHIPVQCVSSLHSVCHIPAQCVPYPCTCRASCAEIFGYKIGNEIGPFVLFARSGPVFGDSQTWRPLCRFWLLVLRGQQEPPVTFEQ